MIFSNYDRNKGFTVLTVLHIASFFIQAGFLLAIYLIVPKKELYSIQDVQTQMYLQYFVILMSIALLPLIEYFLKGRLKKALKIENENERLDYFIIGIIARLGIIEFVNIVSMVAYFLTGHVSFLYISVILTLFFLIHRPVKDKILNDLNL